MYFVSYDTSDFMYMYYSSYAVIWIAASALFRGDISCICTGHDLCPLQVSYMCMFKCPIQKKRRYSQLINKFPAGCLTNNGIVQHWYMFPSIASFPPKLVLFSLFMFLIMLSQDQSRLSRHVNNEGLWRPRSLIFSTMLILNIISLEQYRFLVLNECI